MCKQLYHGRRRRTDTAVGPDRATGTFRNAWRRACERKHAAEQRSQEGVVGISREDLLRRD